MGLGRGYAPALLSIEHAPWEGASADILKAATISVVYPSSKIAIVIVQVLLFANDDDIRPHKS